MAMTVLLDTDIVSELLRPSPGAAARRAAGRLVAPADCWIAAIARSRNMAVATRNVRDFEGCGVEVIDPWRRSPAS